MNKDIHWWGTGWGVHRERKAKQWRGLGTCVACMKCQGAVRAGLLHRVGQARSWGSPHCGYALTNQVTDPHSLSQRSKAGCWWRGLSTASDIARESDLRATQEKHLKRDFWKVAPNSNDQETSAGPASMFLHHQVQSLSMKLFLSYWRQKIPMNFVQNERRCA